MVRAAFQSWSIFVSSAAAVRGAPLPFGILTWKNSGILAALNVAASRSALSPAIIICLSGPQYRRIWYTVFSVQRAIDSRIRPITGLIFVWSFSWSNASWLNVLTPTGFSPSDTSRMPIARCMSLSRTFMSSYIQLPGLMPPSDCGALLPCW